MAQNHTGIALLERDLARLSKTSRLSAAVDNVDRIIEQLAAAREQIATGEALTSRNFSEMCNLLTIDKPCCSFRSSYGKFDHD